MIRAALTSAFLLGWTLPAFAQDPGRIEPVYQALGLPGMVQIMREEGLQYGEELATELFGGIRSVGWAALVEDIYALPRLEGLVRSELASELSEASDADLKAMVDFFGSGLGQRIVNLETTARRALLDPGVEEASHAALADMIRADDPRLHLIEQFSEANALIENNVVGAMNSNYAFYQGLADGGAFDGSFTQEDMLADVWSQEDAIRDDTTEWLYSYLAMAYRPLTDDELRAYIEFSESRPGAMLNQAMFDAFDSMFIAVSLALGHAAAQFLAGQEL